MPNWCKNNLVLYGDKLEIQRAMKLLKDDEGHLTFNKAVPMPLPLEDTTSPTPKDMPEARKKELKKRYGADNWYDWRLKNWGVKWDASESDFYDEDAVTFETPWGPPITFLEKFSLEFPSITFAIQFADEFNGQYPLGTIEVENGQIISESGPEEGTKEAEDFAEEVWSGVWVNK